MSRAGSLQALWLGWLGGNRLRDAFESIGQGTEPSLGVRRGGHSRRSKLPRDIHLLVSHHIHPSTTSPCPTNSVYVPLPS